MVTVTVIESAMWEKNDNKVTSVSCCDNRGTKQMFLFFFHFWVLKLVNGKPYQARNYFKTV